MVFQKKTINNVPTLVPLTADTGSGVPVGTIIGQYKKVNMSGYLYLDGSTFDQTLYPALYAYLGTNVLPDYREFVLVGAEQNTTSSVINQTGHDHDVFTQGQEKDDQLQDHEHNTGDNFWVNNNVQSSTETDVLLKNWKAIHTDGNFISVGRSGTTTRTKEKAVFWYIKATTGIIESEATEMLNVINENNSYSLNEIATGKTWINGKPIYRKVIDVGVLPNNTTKNIAHNIQDIEEIPELNVIAKNNLGGRISLRYDGTTSSVYVTTTNVVITAAVDFSSFTGYAILEYTKTTD